MTRGPQGQGEGVNSHNNGWDDQHETPGGAKPSQNPLDMKMLISRQRLRGILQSRFPQEGLSERDERPEKREERRRTA
ncbi:hypothetical protein M404DRAFT_1006785 [Pisolithus tinctorius Marx 270]|uniref:Uncharacterized protein n=1 Tax=Pisolithus tinctorius Marx 270 TaxID=870435 RepID=A0A0C3NLF6_PISTI|nr:hypothetical protein M404DRAFT_1006785 [Pisolithus tinctorius Marx 270]